MKRHQGFTMGVAAYPGIIGGKEFSESKSGFLGITAPIGISFSTKHTKGANSASSSSLFLSVIDIGAPFTYRLNNHKAEGLPENISWRKVFAPGTFYVYGFKNSPFSLSFRA